MKQPSYLCDSEFDTLCRILMERYQGQTFDYQEDTYRRIIQQVKTRMLNDTSRVAESPIPVITNKDEFYKYFLAQQPVILKHFVDKDTLKEYTLDKVVDRFGDHTVRFTDESGDTYKSLNHFKENADYQYIHNCGLLTALHPEILDDLQIGSIHGLVQKNPDVHLFVSQMFLGNSKKLRPKLLNVVHNGNMTNFFVMLSGKKKWTMIDPMWSPLLHVDLDNDMCQRFLLERKNNELFDLIPKQVATLEPGDLLLTPYFYWHGVENVSTKTVAIANRCLFSKVRMDTLMDEFRKVNDTWKYVETARLKAYYKHHKMNLDKTFMWNLRYANEEEFYQKTLKEGIDKFTSSKNK
jgi:hypothetical protein